ncbi:TPA: DDE-type integrase/transposase/recombinase, partial [Burkholderia vietnamiensis]|nr:DDE-type integrase/transposase/recombinase [Burkholderia vietnamiensis]
MWTAEGWLFVAAVMDWFWRRIVGCSMSDTMHAKMVAHALLTALWRCGQPAELLHHSDQGSQRGLPVVAQAGRFYLQHESPRRL